MKLNHKILGEGTPVVILHGLFGMLDNWMSFGKALAEDYQVILVDHRNHGRSPHSDEIGFPLFAQDLKNLLDDLGIPKAYVMGHSMGGKTVMHYATAYPENALGLISIDMAAHGYWRGNHDEIFDAILPIDLSQYERRSEIDEELSKKIKDTPIRQFLLKNLTRTNDGYTWKANFKILNDKYDEIRMPVPDTQVYQGPSLFVRGSESGYIRDQDMKYIESIFPKATLQTIDGAGHWIHAEKPAELLSIVRDFLE